MKRLVAVLVAAVAAFALYTVTAPAGQEAVSPKRVAALEKKVAALQKQLTCINTYAPLTRYGDPNGSAGYLYAQPDGSAIATTALDLTAQGDTTSFRVPIVKNTCVRSSFRAAQRPSPRVARRAEP